MKDKDDEMGPTIQILVTTLRGLTDETSKIIQAAKNGDLSARGNSSHFKGRFHEIVTGINETLESVVIPVQEAMRLSKEYANCIFIDHFNPGLMYPETS